MSLLSETAMGNLDLSSIDAEHIIR